MPRGWNGSVIQRRGWLRISFKNREGRWRQRGVGLRDTPENRVLARLQLETLAAGPEAFLPVSHEERQKQLAAGRAKTQARSRARFKAGIGAELQCECCGWSPRPPLGRKAINAHHIVPASAGGSDEAENLIALCPNCHAMAHAIFGRKPAPGRAELVAAIREATA